MKYATGNGYAVKLPDGTLLKDRNTGRPRIGVTRPWVEYFARQYGGEVIEVTWEVFTADLSPPGPPAREES